jgi:hypothetical protein
LKAKFVYESIRDILRPKSKEEIADVLKGICKHLKVSPEEMEICKLPEYIERILSRPFVNFKQYKYNDHKRIFQFSDKYKLIRYGIAYQNFRETYYIFPRKEINKILTELILNNYAN